MLSTDMSWSTPTVDVQVLQLANDRPPETFNEVSGPDPAGRKRRRIAPITFMTAPSTKDAPLEKSEHSRAYDTSSQTPLENWDYLAKWHAADASVVEDFEEEEEEYYTDASDTSTEALDETGHESEEGDDSLAEVPTTRPGKLGTDRVTEIINECIEVYTNTWKPGKDEKKPKYQDGESEVPVVYDTITMRKEAQAAGQLDGMVKKHQEQAEYYRRRLDMLCGEISKDPGDTVAGVQKKCRNLEVTVELLEQEKWLTSIYETPLDANSGDESQTEDSVTSKSSPRPAVRLLERPANFVDLGTPSDSSESETDVGLRKNGSNKRGSSAQIHFLAPDPIIADTNDAPGSVVAAAAAAAATLTATRSRTPLGDAPEHASIATVGRWSWSQLTDTQDRKRSVSKAISNLSSTNREMMRQMLQNVGRAIMTRQILACVNMLLRNDARIPGVLPRDLRKIITVTNLFLCWWLCGDYFSEKPSKQRLEELATCLRQDLPDLVIFWDYVDTVMKTTFSREALSNPIQPEIIEISDDDEALRRVSEPAER